MQPTIIIKKSTIPIIWIDTSIIVNLTRYRLGIRQDKTQQRRSEYLYNSIKHLVAKGKLICPIADQHEEIWVDRNEFIKTIQRLSIGISTDASVSVQQKLFCIFSEAFLTNAPSITLDYTILFSTDPVEELKEILSSPFAVATTPPLIGGAAKAKEIKHKILSHANKIREENVKNNISFLEQKELEFMAEFNVIEAITKHPHVINNLELSAEDIFFNFLSSIKTINLWNKISAQHDNPKTILDFYRSNYYRKIPYQRISVEFFAKLMTDKQPIRSGDYKDIEHISSTIPFVDIFITDKQRKTQLLKLGYEKEYNTNIFYAGDEEGIAKCLTAINQQQT